MKRKVIPKTHCPKGHSYTDDNVYLNEGKFKTCRTCRRDSLRLWLRDRKQKLRDNGQKDSYVEVYRKASKTWALKNPDKIKTHMAVSNAIETGKLEKGLCQVCGNVKVDGHHPDYSKPLEVLWLCRQHHKDEHRLVIK